MPLQQKADLVPPCLCRLVARHKHGLKAMSHADLAQRSGLARDTISRLSVKKSWTGVRIDLADKFASACGVDLARPLVTLRWLRRAGMTHLKSASPNQRRFFKRVLGAGNPS